MVGVSYVGCLCVSCSYWYVEAFRTFSFFNVTTERPRWRDMTLMGGRQTGVWRLVGSPIIISSLAIIIYMSTKDGRTVGGMRQCTCVEPWQEDIHIRGHAKNGSEMYSGDKEPIFLSFCASIIYIHNICLYDFGGAWKRKLPDISYIWFVVDIPP